ncbi:MAG: phosphoethanolamine--lipid A transferase [Burkholderiaceae bacterium]
MSAEPQKSAVARPARAWAPGTLVLIISCWLALVGNLPLWRALRGLPETGGWRGLLFSASFALWIAAALVALLSLLAWPRLVKPIAALLLIAAALSSYFMLQYGVVVDATMMANVLHTDLRETRDLLSWWLLLSLLVVAGLPLWWLARRPVLRRPLWSQAWRNLVYALGSLVLAALLTMAAFQDLASLMRNHKEIRYLVNPLNVIYGSGQLLADTIPRARLQLQPIGLDARLGPSYAAQQRTPLLVVAIGETARAANFSLGGYGRPTNPELQQLQAAGGLTYYSDVHSCGTNTQASVPCMFSHLGKRAFEATKQPYENLLDVLQHAGLAVLWLDNQSGCKSVCERVPNALTQSLQVPGLCADGECFDEIMLRGLDERIAALDPVRRARGVVIVMHQMGSHGPAYFRRSPPAYKKFMPECASNVLQDCTHDQLVNAYDNTLVYTDHVLASTARWLEQKAEQGSADSALLYVSDHGESLGENNVYLHGLPYALAPDFQTHVPMVTWVSGAMQKRSGLRMDCLRQRASQPLSHDNLFHSVLGLLDVQTGVYRRDLDLFAPCR